MDPEEYEKIFGYLSDKKYPNDIKESEKRRIRKMSYKFVIEGSDLFYLEKDKLSDNMIKRLVITKDKLSTVLKMCHNSSGHQGVNKTVNKINERYYWKGIVEDTRKFVKQCEICQRYQNKFHIGGINFPMKYVPGTNFSLKKFRQNKFSVK